MPSTLLAMPRARADCIAFCCEAMISSVIFWLMAPTSSGLGIAATLFSRCVASAYNCSQVASESLSFATLAGSNPPSSPMPPYGLICARAAGAIRSAAAVASAIMGVRCMESSGCLLLNAAGCALRTSGAQARARLAHTFPRSLP